MLISPRLQVWSLVGLDDLLRSFAALLLYKMKSSLFQSTVVQILPPATTSNRKNSLAFNTGQTRGRGPQMAWIRLTCGFIPAEDVVHKVQISYLQQKKCIISFLTHICTGTKSLRMGGWGQGGIWNVKIAIFAIVPNYESTRSVKNGCRAVLYLSV